MNGMVYSVIQGSYELNKSFIIENFCINKSQPELKCDGKCYLSQQLTAEKEKQEQKDQHTFSMDFGQFIFQEFKMPEIHISIIPLFLHSDLKIDHYLSAFFDSLDNPPQA